MSEPAPGAFERRLRWSLITVVTVLALVPLVNPPDVRVRGTDLLDDPVQDQVDAQGHDIGAQVLVSIRRDDGGELLGDLSSMQWLGQLEAHLRTAEEPPFGAPSWPDDAPSVLHVAGIAGLLDAWLQANGSSLIAATSWSDITPASDQTPCSATADRQGQALLAGFLLLAPQGSAPGFICPDLPGGHAALAPSADETLWLLRVEHDPKDGIHSERIDAWFEEVSGSSPYELRATSTEHVFDAARATSDADLIRLGPWAFLGVAAVLLWALAERRPLLAATAGVAAAMLATVGTLQLLGHTFTLIDLVALPLLLAVGVDGPIWHRRGGHGRAATRSLLLVAAATTAATMLPAALAPVPAVRGLALVVVVGVVYDWAVTRVILEPWLVAPQATVSDHPPPRRAGTQRPWGLAIAALILVPGLVAPLVAPEADVRLDIDQFLEAGHPLLAELDRLDDRFLIAGTRIVPIIVQSEETNASRLIDDMSRLERDVGQLPGVARLDLVVSEVALAAGPATLLAQAAALGVAPAGVSFGPAGLHVSDPAADPAALTSAALAALGPTLLGHDPLLIGEDGQLTGYLLMVVLDVRDLEQAARFDAALSDLAWVEEAGLSVVAGGAFIEGARLVGVVSLAERTQVLAAAAALLVVGALTLRRVDEAILLALGGLSVAGVASFVASVDPAGRGLMTTPAMLLAIGLSADHLSHALRGARDGHAGTAARAAAAGTSALVFAVLLGAAFPPTRQLSLLVLAAVLTSAALAMAWAWLLAPSSAPAMTTGSGFEEA